MITDVNQKSVRSELDRATLAEYWQGYFLYQTGSPELHSLAEESLSKRVNEIREKNDKPFIDSQQIIGELLTSFGTSHNFHRKFREQNPDLHPNQILGMHLYDVMLRDDEVWVYMETQHAGHLFPHATYFKPNQKT